MKLFFCIILAWSYLLETTSALQVTPNSKCASLCLDESTADTSDPNSSNTYGSDIVCTDSDYTNTSVGQKFEQCLNCLQNSTANSMTESDQAWFLFNTRFAFTTCLYNAVNASQPFSTPCSINTVCGPLQNAFQAGVLTPSLSSQYDYCGADNGTFSSTSVRDCGNCLKENSDQLYLRNFFVALDAGCIQQPSQEEILGLQGSLFSTTIVNITSPVITIAPTKKKVLSIGGIAGIVAAAVVLVLVSGACIFVCRRKRIKKQNLPYQSGLDNRYGNSSIGVPLTGAYNDLHRRKPTSYESVGLIKIPPAIRTSDLHDKFTSPDCYTPDEEYYNHNDPKHNHEELARHLGFRMSTGDPGRMESQSPLYSGYSAYSPPGSTQRTETPSTAGSKTNLYDKLRPLPLRDTTVPFTKLTLPRPSKQTSPKPSKTSPPIAGWGLPKSQSQPPPQPLSQNPLPTYDPASYPQPRSQPQARGKIAGLMITTTNEPTPPIARQSSLNHNFSRRLTRDLSEGRDRTTYSEDRRAERRSLYTNAVVIGETQISGPMVTVGTRFDEDEEAKRKFEREKLYREGYAKQVEEETSGEEGLGLRKRPSGDSVEGLW